MHRGISNLDFQIPSLYLTNPTCYNMGKLSKCLDKFQLCTLASAANDVLNPRSVHYAKWLTKSLKTFFAYMHNLKVEV